MTSPREPSSSRRRFLALTVVGASVAAAAGGVTWWVRHQGELDSLEPPEPMSATGTKLAELIRKRLATLDLPEQTVAKWVNRFEQHHGPFERTKVSRKDLQNFLLSTDLFPSGDDSKPLQFVSYYDPYISVCYNPLRHAE